LALYNNEEEVVEFEMSEGEKDIGVLVDRNLSFSKHITQKVNGGKPSFVEAVLDELRSFSTFFTLNFDKKIVVE
jgi:hypothetical protein